MRWFWKTLAASVSSLLIVAGPLSNHAAAQISGIEDDGWHTWQVAAVAGVPDMCCYSWRRESMSKRNCDLDGRNGGFGGAGESERTDEYVQIYVFMEGGSVARIRALSSDCPVTASSEIADLGSIDADDSVQWLKQLVTSDGADAVAAIAVHDGSAARDILVNTATHDVNKDHREEAIFWMAQTRVKETSDTLKKFIHEDEDPEIREHAAFAYSQSTATDVADVLIRQGKADADPDVRSQAWFWLAETGADESEGEIRNALLHDKDQDVREEAVFALSQLPEERAMRALVQIIEDRQMSPEMREQALFWLAQSESADAFAYIDSLLGSN